MASPSAQTSLSGVALRRVREGLLSEAATEEIQLNASQKNRSFFTQLKASKKIDSESLARIASQEFGLPLVDISAMELDGVPVSLMQHKLIERHQVLTLHKRGTKLFVAITDPANPHALDEIKFHTGLAVEPIPVNEKKLATAIEGVLEANDTSFSDLEKDEGLEDIDISSEEEEGTAARSDAEVEQIDTAIVRFVNKAYGLNKGPFSLGGQVSAGRPM